MRILIVRVGRAGDMVMTTPAIKALISCHQGASFTLLTSPDGNRLLRDFDPAIADIWVWNRSALDASLQKIRLKKRLKRTHFDKIICFETRPSIISLFRKLPGELFWHSGTGEVRHSARLYLDLAEKACSQSFDDIPVNLPVGSESASKVDIELAQAGIQKDDIVIAMHPTFSGYSKFSLRNREARKHKLWPTANFAKLAAKLQATPLKNGRSPKIIMDLLEEELVLGKEIVRQSDGSVQLLNVKPNFARYKALLKRVDLLVSPDTGPMHIAAAVNTRIVALFSGKDPADCGPFMAAELFSVLRAESTDQPENGITSISVESTYDACLQQLERIQNNSQE